MASRSSASTSSQTQANTTTVYNTTDQRQGVEGQGNLVAGAGATVTVNDQSEVIAKAALEAAQGTSQTALEAQTDTANAALAANTHVASDALARVIESQRKSLDSVNYAVGKSTDVAGQALTNSQRAVDTVSKTFSDLSADQVNLISQVIRSNADTTQAAQQRNADLANSFLEKSVTAIADSKTDTNEKIVTTAVEYGAYAAIAIALAFGLLAYNRSKN